MIISVGFDGLWLSILNTQELSGNFPPMERTGKELTSAKRQQNAMKRGRLGKRESVWRTKCPDLLIGPGSARPSDQSIDTEITSVTSGGHTNPQEIGHDEFDPRTACKRKCDSEGTKTRLRKIIVIFLWPNNWFLGRRFLSKEENRAKEGNWNIHRILQQSKNVRRPCPLLPISVYFHRLLQNIISFYPPPKTPIFCVCQKTNSIRTFTRGNSEVREHDTNPNHIPVCFLFRLFRLLFGRGVCWHLGMDGVWTETCLALPPLGQSHCCTEFIPETK